MNQNVSASILPFKDQLDMAERELSAFFAAVETSFGPEQAKLSAGDWLDATEQVLGLNQPSSRDWRAVTVVASSRLAHRLAVAPGKASVARHDSFSGPVKPRAVPDSTRSKQESIVWESSNIDSSPR